MAATHHRSVPAPSPGDLRLQGQVNGGGAAPPLPGPALLHLPDGGERAAAAGAGDPAQHHRSPRQPRQAAGHQVWLYDDGGSQGAELQLLTVCVLQDHPERGGAEDQTREDLQTGRGLHEEGTTARRFTRAASPWQRCRTIVRLQFSFLLLWEEQQLEPVPTEGYQSWFCVMMMLFAKSENCKCQTL